MVAHYSTPPRSVNLQIKENLNRIPVFSSKSAVVCYTPGVLFVGHMKKISIGIIKFGILAILAGGGIYWWKFSPVEAQSKAVCRSTLCQTVFGTGTLEVKTRVSISPFETGMVN